MGPQHRSQVVALLGLCLDPGWTEGVWQWKHHENPFGPSLVAVALDRDRVVAVRGLMRWTLGAPRGPIAAGRSVDSATHPDYRRRGLFSKLTASLMERAREEEIALIFNTPNSESRAGYMKLGWGIVEQCRRWVRPLRLTARPRRADPAWSDLERPWPRRPGIATEPTAEYLNWRYGRIPHRRYSARRNEDALIIHSTRPGAGKLSALVLSELLFPNTARGAWSARGLLSGLLGDSTAHYAVTYAPPALWHRLVLLSLGFLPVPRGGPLLVERPLRGEPTRDCRWQLSFGDLELL